MNDFVVLGLACLMALTGLVGGYLKLFGLTVTWDVAQAGGAGLMILALLKIAFT